MESLLSLSFDYLSSHDSSKIRKGLRQLEGLLAQICLSRSGSTPTADKRRSIAVTTPKDNAPKELARLKDDAAFREFFKLQEGFECNAAMRLITCLERLLSHRNTERNDLLIVSTLNLLHGILLMHPPSRSLFAREIYMNLLLDLLDPTLCPAIHSATLLTLVTALLATPKNTRMFETVDGLLTVTTLFKARSAPREVKLKSVEFIYFYLMPETPAIGSQRGYYGTGSIWGVGPRSPSKAGADDDMTRTTEEKQGLLGRYLGNVEDLVDDLREGGGLGGF